MSSITEFLLARIAEDEALARTASTSQWEVQRGGDFQDIRINDGTLWITVVDGSHQSPPHGEWIDSPDIDHIVRHDPARVLAECESKRAIIKAHENWPILVDRKPTVDLYSNDLQSTTFHMSVEIAWLTEREYVKRFGTEPPTAPMMRALAAVYSGHPDYREDWS